MFRLTLNEVKIVIICSNHLHRHLCHFLLSHGKCPDIWNHHGHFDFRCMRYLLVSKQWRWSPPLTSPATTTSATLSSMSSPGLLIEDIVVLDVANCTYMINILLAGSSNPGRRCWETGRFLQSPTLAMWLSLPMMRCPPQPYTSFIPPFFHFFIYIL